MTKKSELDRFKKHVAVVDDCWEWTGKIDRYGYGVFKVNGATQKAHRWIYQRLNFTLPQDIVIDHLCRNRKCVRPAHLEAVTGGENTRRGISHR